MNARASTQPFLDVDFMPSALLATPTYRRSRVVHCCGKGLTVEPLGQRHIFRTQMRVKDGNKDILTTYPEKEVEVLLKIRMRENLTSDSVRGLLVISELLLQ